jgi:TP901 family phage tail tape measure protein
MAALGTDITISIIGQDMASPAFAAAGRGLDDLEKKAGIVGSAFNVAMASIAAGGVAVAGGLTAAITSAAGFEKQISAIAAVSGATSAQLDGIRQTALQLGKDTSFSASEAAAGMEEMIKAGISLGNVMAGAGRAGLDLAAAGGLAVSEAAAIMSNSMNVFSADAAKFGSQAEFAAHAADMIAGAANASAIDVHDFGFSLASAGAVAATVGISFDDLATGIAVMGAAGIKGSDAGTSLKTMLLNLTPSTKSQIAAAKELGIITKDGSNQFFDATGKAKGLADIAEVLQNATQGLTQQQKLQRLETLFGTDAIRAAAIMANAGAEGFRDMGDAMAQSGGAQAVANTRLDNLAGSIEKFKGSAETAGIIIGSAFLPAMKRMVDGNTDALNAFIPTIELWAKELPAAINVAMDAFDDLKLNIAEAVHITGDMILDWWNRLAPNFENVRDTLVSQLTPAFTVITQQIIPAFAGTAQIIGSAITTYVLPALGTLITEIGTTLAGAINWFSSTGGPAMATFITGTLNPAIAAWVDWIGPKLQPAIVWLFETALPALGTAIQDTARWVTDTAVPALRQFGDWLQEKLEGPWQWLTGTALPAIVSVGQTVAQWITGTAVPAFQQFSDWMQAKLEAAWSWLTGTAMPAIGAAVQTASGVITTVIIPALTEFGQWLQPQLEAAWSWFTATAMPGIVTAGQTVATWITGTAVPAFTELQQWLQPRLQPAMDWLTGTGFPAITTTGGTVVATLQNITTWIGNVAASLSSNQQFWTNLDAAWQALSTIGAEFVKDVLGPMDQGLKDNGASAHSFAEGLSEVVGLIKPMVEFGQQLADTLNSIQKAANDAGLAIRGFLRSLGVPLPDNPIPGIIPSAPGSQSSSAPKPPEAPNRAPVLPGPIFGPAIPPEKPQAPPANSPAAAGGMPPYTTDLEKRAYQYAVAAGHPNPVQFVEQIRQESNFDPGAYNKGSGATGVAQIIPRFHPGVDPNDPDASLRYAAGLMARNYAQYGDPNVALAAYNAGPGAVAQYGGVPPYAETQDYIRKIAEREAYARSLGGGAPATGTPPPAQTATPATGQMTVRSKRTGFESQISAEGWAQTVNKDEFDVVGSLPDMRSRPAGSILDPQGIQDLKQTQQQWSGWAADANDICGPRLASMFADAVGRPPTPEEARGLAEKMGIYSVGPNGRGSGILAAGQFDEYGTALIQQLNPGSTAKLEQTGATGAAAGALAQQALGAGSPLVGFNTGKHYFGATDYDPTSGKFNVGGTGTSLINGKEWMSISEIEALGGAITGVITLVDGATGSFATMSQSVQTVGAAAAAGAPQLTEIGTAINPVVAAFSEGQASAQSLTDAIITQAGASGVATETAAGYSQGLIGQDEALRAVVASFAETTPAAAALLEQMDAGTISTDGAAMAFAGLSTTTAEASGALTAMGEGAAVTAEVMATDVTGSTELMATDASIDAETMAMNVVTSAGTMQAEAAASGDALRQALTDSTGQMASEAGADADMMKQDVTTAAQTMQTEATTAAQTLHTDVATAMGEARTDATTAAQGMQTGVTTAAGTMHSAAGGHVKTFASEATSSFNSIKKPAEEAAASMEAIGDVDIPAPDVSDVLEAHGGGSSKAGAPAKAAGGSVFGGTQYLVGERGPELFTPSTGGYITPNERLRSGDVIDYDRLAAAIARVSGKTYSLTVNTQASHEPIVQDFALLESLSRSGS